MNLDEIIAHKRVLICVGSGGVGKTTTAAALALHAALQGKRALVMTIDPARRLANSLGLSELGHEERQVPASKFAEAGLSCPGQLWAMMLDAKRAFDEMVTRHSPTPEVRDRVLGNRIYQYISTRLPGSQEYMAMEKLHAIAADERFDLIVLDTPPTQNALDFLDAPGKLIEGIDSAAIRWFLKPFEKGGSFSLRVLGFGSAYVLKTLSRFTGSGLLEEIAHFLLEFNALLGGFKARAAETLTLLRAATVSFILVTSPEPLAIDEAIFFFDKLREAQMPFGAFVVNRVHREYPAPPAVSVLHERLNHLPIDRTAIAPTRLEQLARELAENQAEQRTLSEIDRQSIERLREQAAGASQTQTEAQATPSNGTGGGSAADRMVLVPAFDNDIHDLEGLGRLGSFLFSHSPATASSPRLEAGFSTHVSGGSRS